MKNRNYKSNGLLFILTVLFIFLFFSCNNHKDSELENNSEIAKVNIENEEASDTFKDNEIAIESPPFTDGIFPCSDCHIDIEANPTRRQLVDMHDDIDAIFSHDKENRWCLDCHSIDTRDSLRLASGKLIGFDESYKLCGQCHGDKLRDWKVGVHGKRTGEWNGKKHYLLCVHCHNPHSPKFEPIKPLAPPVRQEDINFD